MLHSSNTHHTQQLYEPKTCLICLYESTESCQVTVYFISFFDQVTSHGSAVWQLRRSWVCTRDLRAAMHLFLFYSARYLAQKSLTLQDLPLSLHGRQQMWPCPAWLAEPLLGVLAQSE